MAPPSGIEGVKLAIARPAAEHDAAGSHEHTAPVRPFLVLVRPHLLGGVHVPRLHFADVICVSGLNPQPS
jgi:hypothetical protein